MQKKKMMTLEVNAANEKNGQSTHIDFIMPAGVTQCIYIIEKSELLEGLQYSQKMNKFILRIFNKRYILIKLAGF